MIFKFLLAATLLRIVPLFNPKRVLTLPKDFLLKVLKVSMAIISHMSYFASGSFRNWIVETSSCSSVITLPRIYSLLSCYLNQKRPNGRLNQYSIRVRTPTRKSFFYEGKNSRNIPFSIVETLEMGGSFPMTSPKSKYVICTNNSRGNIDLSRLPFSPRALDY